MISCTACAWVFILPPCLFGEAAVPEKTSLQVPLAFAASNGQVRQQERVSGSDKAAQAAPVEMVNGTAQAATTAPLMQKQPVSMVNGTAKAATTAPVVRLSMVNGTGKNYVPAQRQTAPGAVPVGGLPETKRIWRHDEAPAPEGGAAPQRTGREKESPTEEEELMKKIVEDQERIKLEKLQADKAHEEEVEKQDLKMEASQPRDLQSDEFPFLANRPAGLSPFGNTSSANVTTFPQSLESEKWGRQIRTAQFLGASVAIALLPVLLSQGLWAFISVSMLLVSLTLVQVAMRCALHEGLPFPYTLTALHMILTVATSLLAGPPREGEIQLALKTLPASLAGGAAVMLSNVALTYASVSFVTMMGSVTPVVTYFLEISIGMRAASLPSVVPVLMAFVGGALCVHGEHSFSLAALCLVLMGCCSRSLKSVWQQSLLSVNNLGPARLATWGGVWTLVLITPAVIAWEGMGFFRALPHSSQKSQIAALISCVSAVILNLAQWTSLQYLGPVMQHMFGNLQLVFVLILASLWLNEDCTPSQWTGTGILVAGVLVAKTLHMDEPKTAAPAKLDQMSSDRIKLPNQLGPTYREARKQTTEP